MDYTKQLAVVVLSFLVVYCIASPTTTVTPTTNITHPLVSNNDTSAESNETIEEVPKTVDDGEVDFFILDFQNIFGDNSTNSSHTPYNESNDSLLSTILSLLRRDVSSLEENEPRSSEEVLTTGNAPATHPLLLPGPSSLAVNGEKKFKRDNSNVLDSISSDKDTRSEDSTFPKYLNKRSLNPHSPDYFLNYFHQTTETARSSTPAETISTTKTSALGKTETDPKTTTETTKTSALGKTETEPKTTTEIPKTSALGKTGTEPKTTTEITKTSASGKTETETTKTSTLGKTETEQSTTIVSSTTETTTPTQRFNNIGLAIENHHSHL